LAKRRLNEGSVTASAYRWKPDIKNSLLAAVLNTAA